MSITCTISGNTVAVKLESIQIVDAIEIPDELNFVALDYDGTANYLPRQRVELTDSVRGVLFRGRVVESKPNRLGLENATTEHTIRATGRASELSGRANTTNYQNRYSGDIAVDFVTHGALGEEGITVAAAMHHDTNQEEFSQGLHDNTSATVEGTLELLPAGTGVTYTEETTADFASGTLTNCTSANDTLKPTTTSAIKMVAKMATGGTLNASTHVKIWDGSQPISSTQRWLDYDIYIDPASPEAKMSVDLGFSDGNRLSTTTSLLNVDAQFILPGPANDLTGLATAGWYHRRIALENYNGNTISYVSVACGGIEPGLYTGYFKDIRLTDASLITIATFFSTSLDVNPPQQMQVYGYSSTDITLTSVYDLYADTASANYGAKSYKTTASIGVDDVALLRSARINWTAIVPEHTALVVKYSLNSGESYTICANNELLPELPAGLDLVSKSLLLQYQFYALPEALPEVAPTLSKIELSILPSYEATKTDVTYEATTQSDWNAGTLSDLIANSSDELTLNGIVRTWDDGSTANQTLFTTGGGQISANNRTFTHWNVDTAIEGRTRFDFAGQRQNFTAEIDVKVDSASAQYGLVYRTSNWQNNNNTFAYVAFLTTADVELGRGTNSTSGGGSYTQINDAAISLEEGSWHRLKVAVSGNSHKVSVDEILMLDETDSTYTGQGYLGTRMYNFSLDNDTTAFFDNFGVVAALSGTWTSPNTSLTSVGTYGNSVISWRDKSPSYNGMTNTAIRVEASINGGSSYADCINGQPLPGLTNGQSLSGANLKIRITLSSSTAASLAAIDNLVVRVLGEYSSSGERSTAPLGLDTMVRSDVVGSFGTPTDGQSYTKTGTGDTDLTDDRALISDTTGDVHMRLGSRTHDDMDSTVPFRLSASTVEAGEELRYVDADNFYRLSVTTTAISISKKVSGVTTVLATTSVSLSVDTGYYMRFRVVGLNPVALYGNVWLAGELEPTIDETTHQWDDDNWILTAAD